MMKKKCMKKALACLIAVAMVCTLLVPGCITAFASGAVFNVTSAAQLKEALDQNTEVEAINITESFALYEEDTILFDAAHLDYYHDTVMTIAAGVTLTVGNGGAIGSMWPSYEGDWETGPLPNGKGINNGTVIVEAGGATEADFDTNNGTILVKAGGCAVCCHTNNGTVTVEAGGEYATTQGSIATNNGQIHIQNGAAMESRFGTKIVNAAGGNIELEGQFRCGAIGDGFWFENHGTVTGNGDIILYEAAPDFMPVSDMDALIEEMMAQLGQTTRYENWDDVNIYKQITVSDFAALKAAMSGKRIVAGEVVEGDMDTLIDLTGNIEIPAGESLGAMVAVTVPEGVQITVNSGATLSCGLENHGTIAVLSGGNLYTTQGGAIRNHNRITINEGAVMKSQMGGKIINQSGATLVMNGTCYCGCIGLEGNDICWLINEGNFSGTGSIKLYEAAHDWMPIADMEDLISKVAAQISGAETTPTVSAQLEHEWGDWEQTKAPTCTQAGEETATCSICRETKTQPVAPLGHSPKEAVRENEVAATCTHKGTYEEVIYCSVCGEELSRAYQQSEMLSHTYESIATQPTCTHAGYTTYTCADCGYSYIGDFVPMTEHSYHDTVMEPTTESQGYTVHTCSVCGYCYVDSITDMLPSQMHYIIPSLADINTTLIIKSDENTYTVTAADGVFELDNIKGDVYRVYLKQKNSITVCAGEYDTKSGEVIYDEEIAIPLGDVNDDDVIDFADISMLLATQNYAKANTAMDLTGDDFIGVEDIAEALKATNYGKASAEMV